MPHTSFSISIYEREFVRYYHATSSVSLLEVGNSCNNTVRKLQNFFRGIILSEEYQRHTECLLSSDWLVPQRKASHGIPEFQLDHHHHIMYGSAMTVQGTYLTVSTMVLRESSMLYTSDGMDSWAFPNVFLIQTTSTDTFVMFLIRSMKDLKENRVKIISIWLVNSSLL